MIEFLKSGKVLNRVTMNMNLQEVYDLLGEPDDIIGDRFGGYIYYKEYRFGYDSNNKVNEMAIEFFNLSGKISLKNLKIFKFGIELSSSFKLSKKTKIHKFIRLLYFLDLKWEVIKDDDFDYLTFKIINGPFIVFSLADGNINKISIVDGYQ